MRYYPTVTLTQPLENVIRRGHPWIFADAVKHDASLKAGDVVDVLNASGEWLARGVIEPDSVLRIRIWTLRVEQDVDARLLETRIKAALKRRPFPNTSTTGFRLLNGEGDRIPGLVCDIYDTTAVLRPDGVAAERWLKPAKRIISKLLKIDHWVIRRSEIYRGENPSAMWWNDGSERPDGDIVRFLEEGVHFMCDPISGQKTGFFLDQRENRQRLAEFSRGKRMLNLFGYTGGFSVVAAMQGAARTTTVDLAEPAIDFARKHFELNGLPSSAHEFVVSDVFAYLEQFSPASAPFEVAVCDPPSFAHKRQDLERASNAYVRLFSKLLEVMPTNSTIAMASCSSHIDRNIFLTLIADAAEQAQCALVLSGVWGAGIDHPTLPGFPEGDYLQFALGTLMRDA